MKKTLKLEGIVRVSEGNIMIPLCKIGEGTVIKVKKLEGEITIAITSEGITTVYNLDGSQKLQFVYEGNEVVPIDRQKTENPEIIENNM